jgi:uncharacterized MAPEG superfamily protein
MLIISVIYIAGVIWLSAAVQHVANLMLKGSKWVTSDRSQPVGEEGFAGRAARTLRNNSESALMYVPIALVASITNLNSPLINWLAAIYMAVRTFFSLGYWFKINPLRSLSWLIGMVTILILAIRVASLEVLG